MERVSREQQYGWRFRHLCAQCTVQWLWFRGFPYGKRDTSCLRGGRRYGRVPFGIVHGIDTDADTDTDADADTDAAERTLGDRR